MSTTKKITKREQYNVLLTIIDTVKDSMELPEGITFEDLTNFVNHEIEMLDAKAAAAQKRAAAKKEEGDALREQIYNVLSDTDFMAIDDIVAAVSASGVPDVRRNAVTSRLGQLGRMNRVEKGTISVGEDGKSRKIAAYRKA